MIDKQTRRGFIFGAGAACFSAAGCAPQAKFDDSKTIIMSDTHIAKAKIQTQWGPQPDYQNAVLSSTVDNILAMRPLPRRVVVLGDVSLWFGYLGDYEVAFPIFERLKAAGIEVHLAPGNHDHRAPMISVFPECAERSPVKGRIASVVDLGSCDLFLLDTLIENPEGEGKGNPTNGALDEDQGKWIADAVQKATRPFLVASHHQVGELRYEDKPLLSTLLSSKYYCGYIHGHEHRWSASWRHVTKGERTIHRKVCIPSTGWWGDIGFAVMHTMSDSAVLTNVQSDFYYPTPVKEGESRPALWDCIVKDNNARTCTFSYSS